MGARFRGTVGQVAALGALLLTTHPAGAQDVCADNVIENLTCSSVINGHMTSTPAYDTFWEDGIQCSADQNWTLASAWLCNAAPHRRGTSQ